MKTPKEIAGDIYKAAGEAVEKFNPALSDDESKGLRYALIESVIASIDALDKKLVRAIYEEVRFARPHNKPYSFDKSYDKLEIDAIKRCLGSEAADTLAGKALIASKNTLAISAWEAGVEGIDAIAAQIVRGASEEIAKLNEALPHQTVTIPGAEAESYQTVMRPGTENGATTEFTPSGLPEARQREVLQLILEATLAEIDYFDNHRYRGLAEQLYRRFTSAGMLSGEEKLGDFFINAIERRLSFAIAPEPLAEADKANPASRGRYDYIGRELAKSCGAEIEACYYGIAHSALEQAEQMGMQNLRAEPGGSHRDRVGRERTSPKYDGRQ